MEKDPTHLMGRVSIGRRWQENKVLIVLYLYPNVG